MTDQQELRESILDAARRGVAAGARRSADPDDYGNENPLYAAGDTAYVCRQAIIGGDNISYLREGGGYASTTRGAFADDPASIGWIDEVWEAVESIMRGEG